MQHRALLAALAIALSFTYALPAHAEAAPTEVSQTKPSPTFGLTAGVLWAYAPATKTGLPLRFGLGVPLFFKAGPMGFVLELGGSSAFTSFDLSPYALAGATGPAGPVRLGGSVLISYSPPWSGEGHGSALVGANGIIAIPLIPKRLGLLFAVGPRHVIGSEAVAVGGAVVFSITPGK